MRVQVGLARNTFGFQWLKALSSDRGRALLAFGEHRRFDDIPGLGGLSRAASLCSIRFSIFKIPRGTPRCGHRAVNGQNENLAFAASQTTHPQLLRDA